MHDLNHEAIRAFAFSTLHQVFSPRQYGDRVLQLLTEEITRKALGVFLWARFAVHESIDGLTRGEEPGSAQLERRLEAVPRELQEIYSRIFRRLSPSEKELPGHFLLLITSSKAIITVEMLQEAVELFARHTGLYARPSISHSESSNKFRKRLFATSGGTVEVYQAEPKYMGKTDFCGIVRLIHRTVNTYLELKGWQELLGDSFHSSMAHTIWLQVCALRVREESNLDLRFQSHYRNCGYDYYVFKPSLDTGIHDNEAVRLEE